MQETFHRKDHTGQDRSYTVQIGKDENGAWVPIQIIPDYPDTVTGQDQSIGFKSLHIESDREGNITINTEFFADQFTPTGLHSPSFSREIKHKTKDVEAVMFFEQLRPLLERGIVNGWIAGGENVNDGFGGHNTARFYNPDGSPNHTEEAQSALPTFDYHALTPGIDEPTEPAA
jgi:hypothetical protein